jgi:DNA polymerase III sliding clamp (beta) subunit (PCNA family)
MDILKNVDTDSVEFKFTGATTPTMVKNPKDNNLIYMIMPLKNY